ncbi:Molybdenum cofactor guanylyltransferase [Haemophilus influenzae]|nr:Molybdenum cofactor guanylyltransferase [Haemophilus influenzae]
MRHYLASGERRLLQFMKENGGISVKFTQEEGNFENFNTLDDLKKTVI